MIFLEELQRKIEIKDAYQSINIFFKLTIFLKDERLTRQWVKERIEQKYNRRRFRITGY